MDNPLQNQFVKVSATNLTIALALAVGGLALAAAGIYIGETDDAPGAALVGILLLIGASVAAVRIARRKPHPDGEKC